MAILARRMDILVNMDNSVFKMAGIDSDKPPMFKENCGRALSSNALMYIAKGNGYFEDAQTPRKEIKPGSIFYLHPGRWHNFDPNPGTVWTECWVLFDGEKAEALFGKLIPEGNPVHQHGVSSSMLEAYESLCELQPCQKSYSAECSLFLLHSILMQAFLKIKRLTPDTGDDTVNRARYAVKKAVAQQQPFDFKLFAEKEGIGYEKFRKEFAKATGMAPLNYLLAVKMGRAMELLIQPHLTIKEIAASLGFEDPYYFSRLFKRREGVSPESYRKSLLRH